MYKLLYPGMHGSGHVIAVVVNADGSKWAPAIGVTITALCKIAFSGWPILTWLVTENLESRIVLATPILGHQEPHCSIGHNITWRKLPCSNYKYLTYLSSITIPTTSKRCPGPAIRGFRCYEWVRFLRAISLYVYVSMWKPLQDR